MSSTTAFICTNDSDFASKCDKVIYLENGMIKAMGKWSEVNQNIKG
jgi:ABC-type polysaccharide/polyol phosphate transport system ATPase subunit